MDIQSAQLFFLKKNKSWKLDIANKELFGLGEHSSFSLNFKQIGKDGVAAIIDNVDSHFDMAITGPDGTATYAYETTTKIIGVENNELHELLSLVTAEEYFYPNHIPYKWKSDIKSAGENEYLFDIAIHSYGVNEKGKYFDRTRRYKTSEGEFKEIWRDDEKKMDKQDKDIDALCQAVDSIDTTDNSYSFDNLKNKCALFKKGEVDEDFPLKSELLEDVYFIHYKQFPSANINKVCGSYDYDAAIKRYSLIEDSDLRNKLKINIIPSYVGFASSEGEIQIYIDNILPAYFGKHKKQALTEGGCIELGELNEADKEDTRNAEDGKYSSIDIFSLVDKKKILLYEEEGEIASKFYLVIGNEPEKHLRLLESTSLRASKVMPVCFSEKGEQWKMKESAIYSVQ